MPQQRAVMYLVHARAGKNVIANSAVRNPNMGMTEVKRSLKEQIHGHNESRRSRAQLHPAEVHDGACENSSKGPLE